MEPTTSLAARDAVTTSNAPITSSSPRRARHCARALLAVVLLAQFAAERARAADGFPRWEEMVPPLAGETTTSPAGAPNSQTMAEPPALTEPTGGNQLWLVSTRKLPDCPCAGSDFGQVEVYRHECGAGWLPSSPEDFLAADSADFVTTVFIHGNDTDAEAARVGGQQLYARLAAGACPCGAMRFVIWSWPSEPVYVRVRPDIQTKACRTNVEAFYLAEFLDRIDPQTRVSVSGYSLGARVASGALHLLGGGVLEGRQLAERPEAQRSGIRAVLIAGAMPDDWLLPGRRYDRAISQTDRLVVMYNPIDPVLRFYPLLYHRGGPKAVGYTGVRDICCIDEGREKVCEVNVSGAVRRGHGWGHYINSPSVIRRLRHELLMHDKIDGGADTASQEAVRR